MPNGPAKRKAGDLLSALALPALLAVFWWLLPEVARTATWTTPLDAGESWLFALTGAFDNYWFPLFPVILATMQYHLPAWLQDGAVKVIFMLPAVLAFSAGALIHSLPAGVIASLLSGGLSFLLIRGGPIDYEQHFEQVIIAITLLTLVNGLLIQFRSYISRGLFAGLLLAAALYAKGVIALFVPVLLIYQALRKNDTIPLRAQWPAIAVVLSAVLVWTAVNLLSGNGFVLLENGVRTNNIALGAIGMTSTIEGDARELAGVASGKSLVLWAAAEALRHPLRYVLAVPRRLYYLLFTQPLLPGLAALFLLWLCAVFRLRRLEAVRPMLLLTLYLFLIHHLLPVEGRYFVPVWFLACTLSGIFLADILTGAAGKNGQRVPGARLVFFAAAAPVLAFFGFSFLLLISYPARSRASHDLSGLQARHPASPWLNHMAAKEALKAGNLDKAAAHYYKAYGKESVRWRKMEYLSAIFKADGISGARLQDYFHGPFDDDVLALAALRYAEEGKLTKAALLLPCALQACIKSTTGLRYAGGSADLALLRKVRLDGSGKCLERLSSRIYSLGAGRREVLLGRLKKILPDLWRPDLLASGFERDNGSMDSLAAFEKLGGAMTWPLAALKACQGVLPAEVQDRRPAAAAVALRDRHPAAARQPRQIFTTPPAGPGSLMKSCLSLAAGNKKTEALQACQAAAGAIDASTGPQTARLLTMRAEAAFRSYKLLEAAGRDEEGLETLLWTVKTAPPDWPGLAEAKKLLEKNGPGRPQ